MNAQTRRRIGQAQALGTMQADTLFQLLIVFASAVHPPAATDTAATQAPAVTAPDVQTVTPETFLSVRLQPDGQCFLIESDGTRRMNIEEIIARAREQQAGIRISYPVTPTLQTLSYLRQTGITIDHHPHPPDKE